MPELSVCERCWADAYMRLRVDTGKSQSEHYRDLLIENRDRHADPHADSARARLTRVVRKAILEWRWSSAPPVEGDGIEAFARWWDQQMQDLEDRIVLAALDRAQEEPGT